MNKHTKGPYYAVLGMVEIDRDSEPDLCSCYPHNYGQEHLLTPEKAMEKAIADAKFIATACESHYEMLEALKAMSDAYQNLLERVDAHGAADIPRIKNYFSRPYVKAQEAIAKAEGEENA